VIDKVRLKDQCHGKSSARFRMRPKMEEEQRLNPKGSPKDPISMTELVLRARTENQRLRVKIELKA